MASITTFFGTQGGGGSVSGTATRVAFFGGTPGNPSTTLDDSEELVWDDSNNRLSVGFPGTVESTLTISGNGASDATSSLEVRTNPAYGDLLLFRVYNNGRIDSRVLDSSEALTSNLAIGLDAGSSLTTGDSNTCLGHNSLKSNTSGDLNSATGAFSLSSNTTGTENTAVGFRALNSNQTASQNTAVGAQSMYNVGTSGNTSVGAFAGTYRGATGSSYNNSSTNSIYIGYDSRASVNGVTNEISIGYNTLGGGSNSVTLGNTSIINTFIRGDVNLSDGYGIVAGSSAGTKIGTSASQKLAFYGDTPVVQPTTAVASATAVHGSGQAVKDDSTFGGYTIGQIVTALQTLGLLA